MKKERNRVNDVFGFRSNLTNTNNTFQALSKMLRVRKFLLEKSSYIFIFVRMQFI